MMTGIGLYPSKLKKRLFYLLCAAAILLPIVPAPAALAASLDVTAYGAAGNDTTDDLAAITSAINAASSGDTVYFPAGTYYVSGAIQAKSDIKLIGESRDMAVIKYAGAADGNIVSLNNTTGVEVANLTLDGNSNNHVTAGIWGEPGSGHYIHHNRIKDITKPDGFAPFGILMSGTDDVIIADNDFQNIGTSSEWGGAIRVGWNSNHPQILRNTIANTGRGGIFVNDGSEGAIVRNNVITGSGLHNDGLAIELHTNVNHALVEDNQVDHWLSVVRSEYDAIRRNTIHTTDGTVKGIGLEIMTNHSVTTDNLVDGGQQVGMQQSPGTGYQYWGYNTVQNLVMWGMQLQGEGTGETEQYQYFYKNIIEDTQIGNPAAAYPGYDGNAVRIHGNSRNITFDSNQIINNGRKAIEITGAAGVDRISFINNIITGNAGPSIDQYPSAAADLEWSGNTVSGNSADTQLTSRGFGDPKPTADFTASTTNISLGQPVTFTNTSTDNGTIVENLWDFGEGVPVTTTSPTYTYEEAGTYRVTLVVWDNTGRADLREMTVVVSAGPPDMESPDSPTGLTSPARTDTSVSLSWNAAMDNVGVAGYEIYRGGTTLCGTSTTTSFTCTGLTPNTTYSFSVKAKDAAGNVSAASSTLSVTTIPLVTGTITREYWSGVSGNNVADNNYNGSPTGTEALTSLKGPTNWGDNYADRIRGYIIPTVSGTYTFAVAGDNNSELWLSSDSNPANKALLGSVTDWVNEDDWNAHAGQTSGSVSLVAGQKYYVEVLHKEANGGDHVSVGWTGPGISTRVVVPGANLAPYYGGGGGGTDTQAPSAPTGLASPSKTSTTVDLSWTASTDNVGVTGYDVFRDGTPAGSTTGATTFTVTGLAANTSYSFTVKAKDAANNVSAASSALNVTTNAGGGTDTQAPSAPTGLASPSKTTTTVNLSWTASTDNVGVTGYDVFRGGTLAGSTTGATTYTVTGLAANTSYIFTVKAKDAANNVSAASSALSVTTNAASGLGSIVREYWTNVSGSNISDHDFGTSPTGTSVLVSLKGPNNWDDNYADRIRGYIVPSVSGTYTFAIAGDNNSELWLSTDSNPANKTLIGRVIDWVNEDDWNANAGQTSGAINLVAGHSYYVEILHKEGAGGDHLSVGWTGPGISTRVVVPGANLQPYE